jgi:hypothetical protein
MIVLLQLFIVLALVLLFRYLSGRWLPWWVVGLFAGITVGIICQA